MSTIPYTLKFNRMGQWARQQSLFKLRDTYVAYGVRGLNKITKKLFLQQFSLLFILKSL